MKEVGGNIAINENIFVKDGEKLDLLGFAGAVAGAQLVKGADGRLSWVKPDTTTVEGLSTSVTALEHAVNGYTDDGGIVHEGLGSKVSTLETKVGNIYTKAEVDAKVSSVMRYKGSKGTYAELPSEGNEIGDVWNVVGADAVNGVRAGDNFAWNGTGWDNLGGAVVLDGYATKDDLSGKVDKVEGSRLMTSAEGEKLAGIATGAEVNVVKSVDDTEFTLDENGKLNIKALGQDKITGLADALAGKVSTEAGKGLSSNDYTDAEKEKLGAIEAGSQANILEAISIGGADAPISEKKVDIPVATAEKLGVVKSSSAKDQIAVGVDGIMSINTVSVGAISADYIGSGITKKSAETYIPTKSTQTISAGQYLSGAQTIAAIPRTYVETLDATAVASDLNSGKTAYVNGVKVTGTQVIQKYYTSESMVDNSFGNDGDIFMLTGGTT